MTDDHIILHPKNVEITAVEDKQDLHPLARALLDKGNLDPDTLERILDLQDRYEAGKAKKSFEIARAQLVENLPHLIAKNRKVSFSKVHYTYADLPQIMRSIIPALTIHGFFVSWRNSKDGKDEVVTCILSHRDGHCETNTRQAPPDTKGEKSAVQASQSTVTYLQRQTLLSILGLVTADLPDADEPKKQPFVDVNRNLRVLQRLREKGIELEEVQDFLQKTIEKWTSKDIQMISNWVREKSNEEKSTGESSGETGETGKTGEDKRSEERTKGK